LGYRSSHSRPARFNAARTVYFARVAPYVLPHLHDRPLTLVRFPRQVGEAIKRSHVYVSRRLRVFEDDVLAPMVLARGLTVSAAEELLRAPDPETRKELAGQAAEQQWTWGEARRAVADLGTVRSKWAAVAVHLRALINDSQEVEPDNLTPADRKLDRRAITALRRLA
jgi:hypothetical protein